MRVEICSEASHQLLFSMFDSMKTAKINQFRIHHHAELELGWIISGEGVYHLGNEQFNAKSGDLFLIRANEQHCIPTITTQNLSSFNIHITPYFLWNSCADFIDSSKLHVLVDNTLPIKHQFHEMGGIMEKIQYWGEDAQSHRFEIRHAVLELLITLTGQMMAEDEFCENVGVSDRLHDVQNAIRYIHDHLSEPMTLDEIAKVANMSRSYLSAHFKLITGIAPYEYLLIQRIERAVTLLHKTSKTNMTIAEECGFGNLANFNKIFKRITGITPRECRAGNGEHEWYANIKTDIEDINIKADNKE